MINSPLDESFALVSRLRLCVARTIADIRPRLILQSEEDVCETLDIQTRMLARTEVKTPSGRSLAQFYRFAQQKLPALLRSVLAAERAASIRRVLRRLDQELNADRSSGTDYLFEASAAFASATASAYFESATGLAALSVPIVVLPSMARVHDLPCNQDVTAKLVNHPQRQIELRFNALEVTDETILAVPYVLLHELICHAAAGRPSAGSATCEAHSPFSEGLMDHIAWLALDETVNRRGPATHLATGIAYPKRCVDIGSSYQFARYAPDAPLPRREVAMRKTGRETGLNLGACLDPGGGCQETARWAIRVNASDLPHADRDNLVVALAGILGSIDKLPAADQASERSRLATRLSTLSTAGALARFAKGYFLRPW